MSELSIVSLSMHDEAARRQAESIILRRVGIMGICHGDPEDSLDYFDQIDAELVLAAKLDERVVGACAASIETDRFNRKLAPTLHVLQIAVEEMSAKQGIGAALMNRAERAAVLANCASVRLYPLEESVGFYERLGYGVKAPGAKPRDGMVKSLPRSRAAAQISNH
jgi:GNAT superfamily N-acetyltransferase